MILDDLKIAVKEVRAERQKPGKGRALHELNLWLGAERKRLNAEYDQRMAEIEAMDDLTPEDSVSPKVLDLVGKAVAQGHSRSNIRIALGFATLQEADEVIRMAGNTLQEKVQAGEEEPFGLTLTGGVHPKGWPLYTVTLYESGETYTAVYLVVPSIATEVKRSHMRIAPSLPGSQEVLDLLWELGVGQKMFALGKES